MILLRLIASMTAVLVAALLVLPHVHEEPFDLQACVAAGDCTPYPCCAIPTGTDERLMVRHDDPDETRGRMSP